MPWDAWALMTIAALCGGVIVWSWWGFHLENRSATADHLRLPTITGGFLEVPSRPDLPTGRHRRNRSRSRSNHPQPSTQEIHP